MTDKCNSETEDSKPINECKAEELKIDMPEDAGKQVKDEAEESDDQKVEKDAVESDDDDDVMETTPEMEDASVIKYSVKTTPYLQRWAGQLSLGKSIQLLDYLSHFMLNSYKNDSLNISVSEKQLKARSARVHPGERATLMI